MTDVQRAAHAKVLVEDFEPAVEFHTNALGMVEVEREGDTVYLGCGMDGNFDLAFERSERTALDHLAFRVDGADDVKRIESRLSENGVAVERVDGEEPGQEYGVRTTLPNGTPVEMVTEPDPNYGHHDEPALPGRGAHTPMNLDHCFVVTEDVDREVEFLQEMLDFKLSEYIEDADVLEGERTLAWTRYGHYHHDLAVYKAFEDANPIEHPLHHLGLTMSDISHMKKLSDYIAQHGVGLESGISRHRGGSNLFAFFWAPGGIRYEMAAEMAIIDQEREPDRFDDLPTDYDVWGGCPMPESFKYTIGEFEPRSG